MPTLRKKERYQINNPILYLKELEKEVQNKLNASRRKEIKKMRKEINEIEKRKAIEKINKNKS